MNFLLVFCLLSTVCALWNTFYGGVTRTRHLKMEKVFYQNFRHNFSLIDREQDPLLQDLVVTPDGKFHMTVWYEDYSFITLNDSIGTYHLVSSAGGDPSFRTLITDKDGSIIYCHGGLRSDLPVVYSYNPKTKRLNWSYQTLIKEIGDCRFVYYIESTNRILVNVGDSDVTIDAATGVRLDLTPAPVSFSNIWHTTVAWGNTGKWVQQCHDPTTYTVYDSKNQKLLSIVNVTEYNQNMIGTEDGSTLYVVNDDGTLAISAIDMKSGKIRNIFKGFPGKTKEDSHFFPSDSDRHALPEQLMILENGNIVVYDYIPAYIDPVIADWGAPEILVFTPDGKQIFEKLYPKKSQFGEMLSFGDGDRILVTTSENVKSEYDNTLFDFISIKENKVLKSVKMDGLTLEGMVAINEYSLFIYGRTHINAEPFDNIFVQFIEDYRNWNPSLQ